MNYDVQQMLSDIREEFVYFQNILGKKSISDKVMSALAKVPREKFVPDTWRRLAFANGPVSIGEGQTISQPFIVAIMTELLEPEAEDVMLEVGTGSGYQAAVLAELVAHVYSIEIIPALAQSAQQRLCELGYENISIKQDNGYAGWPEYAPYDGVIVTAAAPHIPPPLLEQLKPGARLIMPVGYPYDFQELIMVEKDHDGTIDMRSIMGVSFVPLTGGNPADTADSK